MNSEIVNAMENVKALMEDLEQIIPNLKPVDVDVNASFSVNINEMKDRFNHFVNNNLLMRYLIEGEALVPEDDSSNLASALILMEENLLYQDKISKLEQKELTVEKLSEFGEKWKIHWDQLKSELESKSIELENNKMAADLMLENNQAEVDKLQAETECLKEQIRRLKNSALNLSPIVDEARDCDIDEVLENTIFKTMEEARYYLKKSRKYHAIDFWRRMLRWEREFTPNEVLGLGLISDEVIRSGVRKSYDKFLHVHVKPTKGIRHCSVFELFHDGTMQEAEEFLLEAENLEYWDESLNYLRFYIKGCGCKNSSVLEKYI